MERKKKGKKKADMRLRRRWIWWLAAVVAVAACGMAWCVRECMSEYKGDDVRIYLPAGSSAEAIGDTLRSHLGEDVGSKAAMLWKIRKGTPSRAAGSYVIRRGMTALEISGKLRSGAQDAVKVTFNNVRTLEQLAQRVSDRMAFSPEEFIMACASVLSEAGYAKADYPAAFLPDTYEFYWTASPESVVSRLETVRRGFWTPERVNKAKALGLTPEQVATLASIVEEETNKADERPKVARLYLNRLKKGMRLQADPTVKFATGDFSLRRITGQHLKTESPYNTYLHEGLPPGPIRVVERQAIDAVLDAPEHPYLFMCAKEDFSGYHNFAVTAEEHAANARRYHQALNRRGIR